jgi:transcriptional regulator with XRE-family HTH domain
MALPHDGTDHLLALGRRLRALREQAGLTGRELAAALGWTQVRVSRLELARQNVSPADVDAWVAATGASDRDRTLLLGMLDQAREDQHAWRSRFRHGQAAVQAGYGTLYARARHVRTFTLTLIPGTLQTPGYAHHILTAAAWQAGTPDNDIAAAVAARIDRQAYLHDHRKRFDFLIHEAALHSRIAPADVMAEQLDRLATLDLPNARLAVLPLAAPIRILLMCGFTMLDNLVLVETISREQRHTGVEAEIYRRAFTDLWDAALTGDDARHFIANVAADLT